MSENCLRLVPYGAGWQVFTTDGEEIGFVRIGYHWRPGSWENPYVPHYLAYPKGMSRPLCGDIHSIWFGYKQDAAEALLKVHEAQKAKRQKEA